MSPAFAAAASSLETPSRLQIQTETEFDKRGSLAPERSLTLSHYISDIVGSNSREISIFQILNLFFVGAKEASTNHYVARRC